MCSDAANGEYEGFKVKNEVGCSWEGEATTSESRLHLSDILEMLIRLDQEGIFMNPVDDLIAPDYSPVIKNPMCFLKMREKIHAEQYTSWVSFVEDFECICHNAMKYNQKRSKIWNAANLLLRQGKRCLEQKSSRYGKIIGISEVHNGTNLQEEVAAKVKLDQTSEGIQLNALSRNLDKPTLPENLMSNFCEKQGPITSERNSMVSEIVMREQLAVSSTSGPLTKCSDADVNVEILTLEPEPEEDARLNLDDEATECSSSFSGTQSEFEGDSCEEESEIRNGNGASIAMEDSTVTSRRRKRRLDSDWKTYRQGIEWRCRWLEFHVKELQAEANKYRRILEAVITHKGQQNQDGSVARTSTMDRDHKIRVLRRRQRRREEETADLKVHMSKHPLFSRYYEKKKHRNQEFSSTEERARDEKQHIVELDDFLDFEDEYEDNIVVEKNSMEFYLWQIEALQMNIFELKDQLTRGPRVQENTTKELFRDDAPFVLASPRNFSGLPTKLHSPSGLGARPMIRGSKGHGGTPTSRRRNSDFDINNVIMPDTEMANYVEPPRHTFITTPHWRQREDVSAQDEEGSSEEDTDDEVYKARHAHMQMKERQQQYTPLPLNKNRSLSVAKERPKIDVAGRGSAVDATNAEELVNDKSPFPTSFGYIPRKKRGKRESRENVATAKDSHALLDNSQMTEKTKVCTRSNSIKKSEP